MGTEEPKVDGRTKAAKAALTPEEIKNERVTRKDREYKDKAKANKEAAMAPMDLDAVINAGTIKLGTNDEPQQKPTTEYKKACQNEIRICASQINSSSTPDEVKKNALYRLKRIKAGVWQPGERTIDNSPTRVGDALSSITAL